MNQPDKVRGRRKAATSAERITAEERRAFCIALRKAGATYLEIAQSATDHFGADKLPSAWGEREAYKDVKREMDKLRRELTEGVVEIRIMQTQRLEQMIRVHWPAVLGGNLPTADRVLKFIREENALWGLYPPQQVDMRVGDLDAAIERELADLSTLRLQSALGEGSKRRLQDLLPPGSKVPD